MVAALNMTVRQQVGSGFRGISIAAVLQLPCKEGLAVGLGKLKTWNPTESICIVMHFMLI
jgi:hypothetical protein